MQSKCDPAMYAAEITHLINRAESLRDGTYIGPQWAMVRDLEESVARLRAWTPDDRR